MFKEQYGDEWLEQKRADIMPDPARWLANGLINAYWRNKSSIEDIHAGEWEARPSCSGALRPCKNTALSRRLLRELCPACTHFIMLSIRRAKMVGRNGPCRLRSVFSPRLLVALPKQTTEVLLERGLNRNRALGATKDLPSTKAISANQDSWNLFGLAKYL